MWIYEHNAENTARFVLGTAGANPLICFGINPSVAEPDKLDPTLKRIQKYAEKQNFDSWIMLNIYPQRATDPQNIHMKIDCALHEKNLLHISSVLQRKQFRILAAWGGVVTIRDYFTKCLSDIIEIANENDCQWVALGETKNGHPYHPLTRVKGFSLYGTPPSIFDIHTYLSKYGGEK